MGGSSCVLSRGRCKERFAAKDCRKEFDVVVPEASSCIVEMVLKSCREKKFGWRGS